MNSAPSSSRYDRSQRDKSLIHPTLPQDVHSRVCQPQHTFVISADTQFGMTNFNKDWTAEIEYSKQAIQVMNALQPRPLFCCVCGDLVDMTANISAKKDPSDEGWTEDECNRIQDEQNADFRKTWNDLNPDIALVCVCGNHDVGNRPNAATIQRFQSAFGDDYLAFWVNGTYNIVLNTNLFSNHEDAQDLYDDQLAWLEERLEYARNSLARNIFVYGHHPWFLHKETEDETKGDLPGASLVPSDERNPDVLKPISDAYFVIPLRYRSKAMALFQKYEVSAAFSGHYHQNWVTKTSFGMDMIITSSLSIVIKSSGIPDDFDEPRTRGIRIVTVDADPNGSKGKLSHKFVSI